MELKTFRGFSKKCSKALSFGLRPDLEKCSKPLSFGLRPDLDKWSKTGRKKYAKNATFSIPKRFWPKLLGTSCCDGAAWAFPKSGHGAFTCFGRPSPRAPRRIPQRRPEVSVAWILRGVRGAGRSWRPHPWLHFASHAQRIGSAQQKTARYGANTVARPLF